MTTDINTFTSQHPRWAHDEAANELVGVYGFDAYSDAVKFATNVASIAEEHNHHPRIVLEYGSVTVASTTHDEEDTVTEKDVVLAAAIEEQADH